MHPFQEGSYHLFRFVGGTFSRMIDPLRAAFLGNVAPVIRLEGFYAFDSTFLDKNNALFKSDELRWGVGLDWSVKIPFLHPRNYFKIGPQFYHRRVMDYPRVGMSSLQDNNYAATLGVKTSYYKGKLTPSVFYYSDISTKSNFWKLQLTYAPTASWSYTVGTTFFNGEDKEDYKLFQLFDNKDQLYFKVSYKWG